MKNFLKWALIIGMINIVVGIISYLVGGSVDATGNIGGTRQILGWVGHIGGITCLFLGIKQKKDMDPADFTFGRGWVEGFMISLIAAVIIGLWTFIYFSMIDPEMVEAIKNATFAAMAKTQPAQNIEAARGYMEFFISPTGFALIGFISLIFGGMFLSLIISAIVNAMRGKSKSSGEMANA